MNSNEIADRVGEITRQALEIVTQVRPAIGNTIQIKVPLSGIRMPEEISEIARSVAKSAGFGAKYLDDALWLSWTNGGGASKPPTDPLSEINSVLKQILELQVDAARKDNTWSRSEILAALSFLLALITAILGHAHVDVHVDINVPSIGAGNHAAVQPHPVPESRPTPKP